VAFKFELEKKMKSELCGLRWTTLGYHHNWDSKGYGKQKPGKMPDSLVQLGKTISTLVGGNYNPQAAICNYYPAGIGTIGIHADNSG